jgi:hypothetical protein
MARCLWAALLIKMGRREVLTPAQLEERMNNALTQIERSLVAGFEKVEKESDLDRTVFKVKGVPLFVFVYPFLEEGMIASVRLSLQGASGVMEVFEIDGAFVDIEAEKVVFSGECEGKLEASLSIEADGTIRTSLGPQKSQD